MSVNFQFMKLLLLTISSKLLIYLQVLVTEALYSFQFHAAYG